MIPALLTTLASRLKGLREHLPSRPTLKSQVYAHYLHHLQSKLMAILPTQEEGLLLKSLEGFLAENWALVKGSSLSYTSLAKDGTTAVLCDLAEAVSAEKNKTLSEDEMPVTAFDLLMPGLNLSSSHEGYSSYEIQIEPKALSNKEKEELARLSHLKLAVQFDAEHEEQIGETVIRDKETGEEKRLPVLMTEVAKVERYLALKKTPSASSEKQYEIDEKIAALKISDELKHKIRDYEDGLMYDGLKAKQKAYDDAMKQIESKHYKQINAYLVPVLDVMTILRAHILSEDGSSLIPVRVLLEEDIHTRPYHDFLSKGPLSYAQLKHEEARLVTHSSEAQAYTNAKTNLELMESDQSHLLGHLTALCKQLTFYDAHAGVGRQNNAGSGAYPAIIAFYEYYRALDKKTIDKIPDALQRELDLLFSLSSDSSKNTDATGNIATCIGLRRKAIETQMSDQKERLAVISHAGESKQQRINEAKFKLNEAREALIKFYLEQADAPNPLHRVSSLKSASSDAAFQEELDRLPLTKKILEALKVELKIQSLADIRQILTLRPDEVMALCFEKGGNQKIASIINDADTLHDLFLDLPLYQIHSLLQVTQGCLSKCLYNDKDISTVIFALPDEKTLPIILCILGERKLILEIFSLSSTVLNADQRLKIWNAIQDQLGTLIQTLSHLEGLFSLSIAQLNIDQRSEILNAIQGQLGMLIGNGRQLAELFSLSDTQLNSDQRAKILNAIQGQLRTLIRDDSHLVKLFSLSVIQLNADQRTQMLNAIQGQLGTLIRDGRQLIELFILPITQLNADQRSQILTAIQGRLGTLIRDGRQLAEFFSLSDTQLNAGQRSQMLTAIQGQLGTLIKDGRRLVELFLLPITQLNTDQRTQMLTAIQGQLGTLIRDGSQLIELFILPITQLNADQRSQILNAIQGQLRTLIKDGRQLAELFSLSDTQLNADERSTIWNETQDQLGMLIQDGWQLVKLFSLSDTQLNAGQRSKIWNAIQCQLGTLIRESRQLKALFSFSIPQLNADQRTQMLTAIQGQLGTLIRDFRQLAELFSLSDTQINTDQRTQILTAIQAQLGTLIRDGRQLAELFSLSDTQINTDQRTQILTAIQAQLRTLIKDNWQLVELFSLSLPLLNADQRTQMLTAIQGQLGTLIKNGHQLKMLLSLSPTLLNTDQRTQILSAIQGLLGTLIQLQYREQLQELLSLSPTLLNPNQRAQILTAIQGQSGRQIQNSGQLRNFFGPPVTPDLQGNLCNSHQPTL